MTRSNNSMDNSYKPLHQKYRPEKFDEIIGQEAIKNTLKQAITTSRIAPAYLFTGPRGTGKTSSARILARSLNCLKDELPTSNPCGECDNCKTISLGTSLDVIEIDAASNTGVENIRELIERSKFAPVHSRWKVYVIDECHMLSTAAFNALLKTLEEPPLSVVFILATTDPQRVLSTIISRCQRFDFQRISSSNLVQHLQMISEKESISIENNALEIIAQQAQGGLRDAESMLDQLSLLPPPITSASVWNLVGAIPEKEIIQITLALVTREPIELIEHCRKSMDSGRDPLLILQGLASMLRDLVITFIAPDRKELLCLSNELQEELKTISSKTNLEELLQFQSKLKGTESQLRNSMQPRLWLEVLLLGTLANHKNNNLLADESPNKLKQEKYEKTGKAITTKEIPKVQNDLDSIEISGENQTKQDVDLNSLWQQILGRLELPSTRMLLSQQATLTYMSEHKAIIQVTENWIGMVQSRISLINQAIEDTLGEPRKIVLENKLDYPQEKQELKNREEIKESNLNDEKIVPPKASNQSVANKNTLTSNMKENNKIPIEEKHSTPEIEKNAARFADFFNGQILD